MKTKEEWEYCKGTLPKVSRTFALNIDQLEGDTYQAVLLGYLFFRIADTFEDNIYQNELEKIKSLGDYADVFKGNKSLDDRLEQYESLKFRWHDESPDKDLVENGSRVIRCYHELPDVYREIMDPHIVRTSEGMVKFQKRKLRSGSRTFQLSDMEDLEDYSYYVAGVVGMMLTGIFCKQGNLSTLKAELEKHQVQFGAALQLTNIAKDYKKDLSRGWCYIPTSVTKKYNIRLEQLNNLSTRQKQGILRELTPILLNAYDSTLEYIEILPENERAIRIFCIIPFVLAYNTLLHLIETKGNKITREQVAAILTECRTYAGSNKLLRTNYLKAKRRLAWHLRQAFGNQW